MMYKDYNRKEFRPKKPVKNFTDLDIYQKYLELSVFAGKELVESLIKNKKKIAQHEYQSEIEKKLISGMCELALSLPHLAAEAHSKRFGAGIAPLDILDQVMLGCNRMVVYLEQARDILATGIETDRFNEQIKKYHQVRGKTLNLQRVWRKYIEEKS